MPTPGKRLEVLRRTLQRFEEDWRAPRSCWPSGLAAIDRALPGGGLRRGAVHEFLAASDDRAAAYGFLVTLLAADARTKPILWCLHEAELNGVALARLGLSPDRIIFVRARRPNDLLWALEEGLRTPGLVAVIGETDRLDLTASRRLQLAAQATGVTCFVLRSSGCAANNAAMTRWRIDAAPGLGYGSTSLDDFGPLRARWRVRLLRCRGAVSIDDDMGYGAWLVTEGDSRHAAMAEPLTSVVDPPAQGADSIGYG